MMGNLTWRVDKDDNRIVANDPRETIICHMSASCRNREVMKDARLIASAPDLLAFITEWLSRQGNDVNYMTEKARAVIAKATGE